MEMWGNVKKEEISSILNLNCNSKNSPAYFHLNQVCTTTSPLHTFYWLPLKMSFFFFFVHLKKCPTDKNEIKLNSKVHGKLLFLTILHKGISIFTDLYNNRKDERYNWEIYSFCFIHPTRLERIKKHKQYFRSSSIIIFTDFPLTTQIA